MKYLKVLRVPFFQDSDVISGQTDSAKVPKVIALYAQYLGQRHHNSSRMQILLNFRNHELEYIFGFDDNVFNVEKEALYNTFPNIQLEETQKLKIADGQSFLFKPDVGAFHGSELEVALDKLSYFTNYAFTLKFELIPSQKTDKLSNNILPFLDKAIEAISPLVQMGFNQNAVAGMIRGFKNIVNDDATESKIIKKGNESLYDLLCSYRDKYYKGQYSGNYYLSCSAIIPKETKSATLFSHVLSGLNSTFQGSQYTCLPATELPHNTIYSTLNALLDPADKKNKSAFMDVMNKEEVKNQLLGLCENLDRVFKKIPNTSSDTYLLQSLANSIDLASFFAFPQRSISGISHREYIEFEQTVLSDHQPQLYLGKIVSRSSHYIENVDSGANCHINVSDLTKHCLIAGITGSGKTNTQIQIIGELNKRKIPILVLEPAKNEYAGYFMNIKNSSVVYPGLIGDSFSFNPLAFCYDDHMKISAQSHIDLLKSVFNAAFPMYGPMPYLLEEALIKTYQEYGWDLSSGRNIYLDGSDKDVYELMPNMQDLYNQIEKVIANASYSSDLTSDIKAALQVRVRSLMQGHKKNLFLKTRSPLAIKDILLQNTLVNLSFISDDEEKTFLMGLIFSFVYQYLTQAELNQNTLRHYFVIEEAHRLLKDTSVNVSSEQANVKGKALDTFNSILSEVRSYGEGICIVEQIPSKISTDVLKNTDTKIIHRTIARDDRELLGDSMDLDDSQKREFAHLFPGEAVVYQSQFDNAVKVRIPHKKITPSQLPKHSMTIDFSAESIIDDNIFLKAYVFRSLWSLLYIWNFQLYRKSLAPLLKEINRDALVSYLHERLDIILQKISGSGKRFSVLSISMYSNFISLLGKEKLERKDLLLLGDIQNQISKVNNSFLIIFIELSRYMNPSLNRKTIESDINDSIQNVLMMFPSLLENPGILRNTIMDNWLTALDQRNVKRSIFSTTSLDELSAILANAIYQEHDWRWSILMARSIPSEFADHYEPQIVKSEIKALLMEQNSDAIEGTDILDTQEEIEDPTDNVSVPIRGDILSQNYILSEIYKYSRNQIIFFSIVLILLIIFKLIE